jgi:type I restriction enzyme S subunit
MGGWNTAPLKLVAPPKAAKVQFDPQDLVWHLNLDQIEADTGRIVKKKMAPVEDAGSSTHFFDSGNVLYSKLRPYLNKVVRPHESGIATTELVPMRPVPTVLNADFLTYYLRSADFVRFASQFVAGAKMPRVVMKKFWEHEMPLPPPTEQRRIVEILDQADALRKKRTEADKLTDRFLPALFYKMFGDPATNPNGLRKKKLGDLLKVRSGAFLPAKSMAPDGQYPVYGGNGINGYHSEFMFDSPKIVLGRVGAYCGVVHYTEPKCWVTDNALFVAEQSDDLMDGYLTEALRMAKLNQYAGRAGQPLISGNRVYPVEILVPDKTDQEKFERCLLQLQRDETNRMNSAKQTDTLFSVLLYRAFSCDLTAKWREGHVKELLQEMEVQAKELGLDQKEVAV